MTTSVSPNQVPTSTFAQPSTCPRALPPQLEPSILSPLIHRSWNPWGPNSTLSSLLLECGRAQCRDLRIEGWESLWGLSESDSQRAAAPPLDTSSSAPGGFFPGALNSQPVSIFTVVPSAQDRVPSGTRLETPGSPRVCVLFPRQGAPDCLRACLGFLPSSFQNLNNEMSVF